MTKLLSMTAAICIAVFVLFSVHPVLAGDAEWRSCVGAVVSHAAKRKDPNYEHVAREAREAGNPTNPTEYWRLARDGSRRYKTAFIALNKEAVTKCWVSLMRKHNTTEMKGGD